MSFSVLIGKVIRNIERVGDDQLYFNCTDGSRYQMYHSQDCCELVEIEDVAGVPLDEIVNATVLTADESTNRTDPKVDDYDESWTWTFYRLTTNLGTTVIRWYGASNGYYSESVDFELTKVADGTTGPI